MLLGYGYMRNNLVHLGGFPNHQDVADMSNLFYLYSVFIWSKAVMRLPRSRRLKRNGMKKKSIETLQAVCRDENYANAYVPI